MRRLASRCLDHGEQRIEPLPRSAPTPAPAGGRCGAPRRSPVPERAASSSRSILFQTSISRSWSLRVDVERAQHLLDVVRLRGGVLVRHVAHMQDHVGLDHLFQRRAERRDQHGRQIRDEAHGVGQDHLRAVRQRRSSAGSDRASRTACRPPPRRARVRRLNSVDLPALV